jgi:hypothetical protein
MGPKRIALWLVVLACVAGVPTTPTAQRAPLVPGDAARLRVKVDAITRHAAALQGPLTTVITEQEVNAYLAYDAGPQIPVGLTQPYIAILGDGRLSGTATVDLDAVRDHQKPRGWLDPLAYLSGHLQVAVSGTLRTADGYARFGLEAARLGGVPIPKAVVQELLSYYSRSSSNPRGLNLDDPFPLPARIREIDVQPGQALVKQ